MLLFGAFFLAFAIKVPLFPLHTWLPDAHTEAPTAGSVILAGVLLKMGTYGMVRFCVPLFPEAAHRLAPYIAVLAIIGIIYGALVAMVQTDLKRLVAYSSVSHLGFVVLGIFAFTPTALQGAVYQMLNHGVSTGALFVLVGTLYDRRHTHLIREYGGLATPMPVLAALYLFVSLSSAGLPMLNGFVGEFLILAGTFERHTVCNEERRRLRRRHAGTGLHAYLHQPKPAGEGLGVCGAVAEGNGVDGRTPTTTARGSVLPRERLANEVGSPPCGRRWRPAR